MKVNKSLSVLRRNWINIKTAANISRRDKLVHDYVFKYPLSLIILLLSLILTIGGALYLWKFYNNENPPTRILLSQYSNDCIRISDGSITIDSKDINNQGKQTMLLTLHAKCEGGDLKGKSVTIYVTPNLRMSNNLNDSSYIGQFQQYYSFTFPYSGSKGGFQFYFEGNLFGSDLSQPNLDFRINSSFVPQPIPLQVMVVSLSDIDTTNIVPQPDVIYPFAIVYKHLAITDDGLGINLKMTGINRPIMKKNQLLILLIGLGLGLTISMMTTIIYDFVRYTDEGLAGRRSRRRLKKKKMVKDRHGAVLRLR